VLTGGISPLGGLTGETGKVSQAPRDPQARAAVSRHEGFGTGGRDRAGKRPRRAAAAVEPGTTPIRSVALRRQRAILKQWRSQSLPALIAVLMGLIRPPRTRHAMLDLFSPARCHGVPTGDREPCSGRPAVAPDRGLSALDLPPFGAALSLHPQLQCLRSRGDRPPWSLARRLAHPAAPVPLPPLHPLWLRSGAGLRRLSRPRPTSPPLLRCPLNHPA